MITQSQSSRKLRAPRWPIGLVPWQKTVESFLERVAAIAGVQIEIVGATRSQGAGSDSLTFDVGGAGNAGDVHPFYIHDASGRIHAGTVRGEIPTLTGDPIGEAGNALTLSGDFFVYIKAEFDLVFGSHFFLESATLVASNPLTIVTNATPLSDDLDLTGLTLTTYRLIAQVVDGIVQRTQPTITSLNLGVCDASDGTEEGRSASATWTTT
jgi:hypothetical protein